MLWVIMLEIIKEVFLVILFARFLYFWHFQMQKVYELHLWWFLHFIPNYQNESYYVQKFILYWNGEIAMWREYPDLNPKGKCILWT